MNNDIQTMKMIVAGHNASGEPDLFFCKILCTEEQVADGEHYDMATRLAASEGYEPKIAFDTIDPAGKELAKLYWKEPDDCFQLVREALADLEGIMPEFEPSGDRQHPAWTTIERLKDAVGRRGDN